MNLSGRWGYRRTLEALAQIGHRGETLLDSATGELDRRKIARIVFEDPYARRVLSRAVHLPVALALFRRILAAWLLLRPLVIVDMPLLFETGSDRYCGVTVVLSVERDTQIARLISREDISRDEAEQRVKAQMPLALKVKRAGVVVPNEGPREALAAKARGVLEGLRGRAGWGRTLLWSPYALVGGLWAAVQLITHALL